MKYIKQFENEDQFLTWKDSEEYVIHSISCITESGEIKYVPVNNNVIAIFNIEQPGNIKLCGNLDNISTILIDGVDVGLLQSYNFEEAKKYTVEFVLIDKTFIADETFLGCNRLTKVIIPEVVTSIGYHAFYTCNSIEKITALATSAPTIDYSFSSINGGGVLIVSKGATGYDTWMDTNYGHLGYCGWACLEEGNYTLENGIYYSKDGKTVIGNDGTLSGAITIKEGVTTIADGVFKGCINITSVNLPNTLTTIGENAFNQCDGLVTITIPNSVTTVGKAAFAWCDNIEEITIGNGITSINYQTFAGCTKVSTLNIPEGVQIINGQAFSGCEALTEIILPSTLTLFTGGAIFKNCTNLNIIRVKAKVAPKVNSNVFEKINKNGTLIVSQEATGYETWMNQDGFYLGYYGWTMQTAN